MFFFDQVNIFVSRFSFCISSLRLSGRAGGGEGGQKVVSSTARRVDTYTDPDTAYMQRTGRHSAALGKHTAP